MNKCENCQRYNSGTCSKDLNKKECNYIEIKSTLEQVKQEWEALGYKFKNLNYKIEITKECIKDEINDSYTVFVKWINIFPKAQQYNSNYLITFQEHQLLTKTFKALGWI